MKGLRTSLVAALAALACHDAVRVTLPTVRVETPVAWAGGSIVLTSPQLVGPDTLPLVVVGNDTVAARFAAPDSLIAAAPDTQGTLCVLLGLRGGGLVPVGTVRLVGGYSGNQNLPIGGFPLPWPGYGVPSYLMAMQNGVVLVDPRTGSIRLLLNDSSLDFNCVNSIGPGFEGRVVVAGRVGTACGPFVALRPDLPWAAPDSGPTFTGGGYRLAVELAPAHWAVVSHHEWQLFTPDSSAWYWVNETFNVAISPSGDRIVPIANNYGVGGIPVFSPASAAPVYRLTGFVDVLGADFSEHGDTLFVAGVPAPGDSAAQANPVLAAIASSDGVMLMSAPLRYEAENLIVDPSRPWVYIVGTTWGSGRVTVHVVDRATLAPVATLMGPPGSAEFIGLVYPVLDAAGRKLFIVPGLSWSGPGWTGSVFTFDLMP
jgi:hypothetical protein